MNLSRGNVNLSCFKNSINLYYPLIFYFASIDSDISLNDESMLLDNDYIFYSEAIKKLTCHE